MLIGPVISSSKWVGTFIDLPQWQHDISCICQEWLWSAAIKYDCAVTLIWHRSEGRCKCNVECPILISMETIGNKCRLEYASRFDDYQGNARSDIASCEWCITIPSGYRLDESCLSFKDWNDFRNDSAWMDSIRPSFFHTFDSVYKVSKTCPKTFWSFPTKICENSFWFCWKLDSWSTRFWKFIVCHFWIINKGMNRFVACEQRRKWMHLSRIAVRLRMLSWTSQKHTLPGIIIQFETFKFRNQEEVAENESMNECVRIRTIASHTTVHAKQATDFHWEVQILFHFV